MCKFLKLEDYKIEQISLRMRRTMFMHALSIY